MFSFVPLGRRGYHLWRAARFHCRTAAPRRRPRHSSRFQHLRSSRSPSVDGRRSSEKETLAVRKRAYTYPRVPSGRLGEIRVGTSKHFDLRHRSRSAWYSWKSQCLLDARSEKLATGLFLWGCLLESKENTALFVFHLWIHINYT